MDGPELYYSVRNKLVNFTASGNCELCTYFQSSQPIVEELGKLCEWMPEPNEVEGFARISIGKGLIDFLVKLNLQHPGRDLSLQSD